MKKIKKIQAIKIGNVVNFNINGKLQKKNCGSPEEANELYRLLLKVKETPTDENIRELRLALNEKTRTMLLTGLKGVEIDIENGEVYLEGFNTPIPTKLVEIIKEYHENKFPLEPVINFWKLLMINPDERVRTSLFDFISTHDFVLTDMGYMVVYKAVYKKEIPVIDTTFEDFLTEKVKHVKNKWKCGANKYVVYRDNDSKDLAITKFVTASKWNEKEMGIEILGKLGDLFNTIESKENVPVETKIIYTDMYSQTMEIKVGEAIQMERKKCDSNPAVDCSYGLHVGATSYVERFASDIGHILVCLVNPANVVAVPRYDHSKMRVAEYYPYATASYVDRKIEIIEEIYFEEDYSNIELAEVEKQIELVKANQLPIGKAKGAKDEARPMKELLKMLENRIIDID